MLSDRNFPLFKGKELAWDLGLYTSFEEERAGYPRLRIVIRAMKEHRPQQLKGEKRDLLKASFNQMFGHNAQKLLNVIKEEENRRRPCRSS